MKTHFLISAALLLTGASANAQPSRDAELHAFLQERFAEDRAGFPDTRYVAGWADLNGDGRPEALVYMMSGNVCGSGGCTLYIYAPEQNSFYQHGSLSVTNLPVRALNSRTRGWRDLSVAVAGGGTRARTVLVPHGRITYPDNPTVPPARTLPRDPPGVVVIGVNTRPRSLF
jgi:hypothetical protein